MDKKFVFGSEMPDSMGACADMFHEVRTVRLAMKKEMEAVQKRETEIKEYMIANLSKSDDTGAAGKRYRVQMKEKRVPRVADWAKFHEYVINEERLDLLQKRLSDKAVMEMYENGELPVGLETMLIPDVSITKV